MQNSYSHLKTPFYIFDSNGFISNYKELEMAMKKYYHNYIPAYSYKTNYTPYICGLVKKLGGYAEVVSDMELTLALKIGYRHNHIIYNGPAKGPMMEEHILNGGISNIDNYYEALRVLKLAEQNANKTLTVGLRINSDIGAGFTSRFGVDVNGPEISKIVNLIKRQPNLKLIGLHMHVSRARYIEAWQKRIDTILNVADSIIDNIPMYIDLGSGMFADMEPYLKKQFKIRIPTYNEYAEIVAKKMAEHYKDCKEKPILFTEPGTTVVARYLSFVTKVISEKHISNHKMAIVDGDFHQLGETGHMMKCPYTVIANGDDRNKILPPIDVVGFTCLEQDILFKDFPDSLSIGDLIEFRNVGGYSIVYKPPFIQPQCPIYAKLDNGELKLIKREETFNDIFKTFIF